MDKSYKTLIWIAIISIVIIALIGGVFTYIYNKTDEKTDKDSRDYAYGMMITCYTIAGILALILLGVWLWNKYQDLDIINSQQLSDLFDTTTNEVPVSSTRNSGGVPYIVPDTERRRQRVAWMTALGPYVSPTEGFVSSQGTPEVDFVSSQGTPVGDSTVQAPVGDSTVQAPVGSNLVPASGPGTIPVSSIQLFPGREGSSRLKISDDCKNKLKELNIKGDLTVEDFKKLNSDEMTNVNEKCFKPNFVFETYPSGAFINPDRVEALTNLQDYIANLISQKTSLELGTGGI